MYQSKARNIQLNALALLLMPVESKTEMDHSSYRDEFYQIQTFQHSHFKHDNINRCQDSLNPHEQKLTQLQKAKIINFVCRFGVTVEENNHVREKPHLSW